MARVTYQASANNKPWSPNITPDTSDRILKQSEDYIQKLKAARDFQAAQDAQFITEYTASIDRGIESQRRVDLEQERQARALASYKQSLLRDQAERAKSVGGSVTGDDSKTAKWLNFVVDASTTAAKTFFEIKGIQNEADKQFVAELRARYPTTFQKIGEDIQLGGSRIAGQRIEAAAAQAELNGDLEQAETLRSLNAGQTAEFTRLSMVDAGRLMPTHFQRDIYAENSLMTVVINGEERPLNTIRTADDMRQAYPQYRNAWMRANGFGDIDNRLYTDGLAESQKGFERVIATTRQEELQASKANRLDQASTAFNIKVKDSDQAQAAALDHFMARFNHNGGDRRAARLATHDKFKDPGVSEEAFLAYQQLVLPGQQKSIAELYPEEIREIRQARLAESQQVQSEFDVQQQMEAEQEARRVYAARIADTAEDNDVDLSPEAVQQQIDKYTRLGPNYTEALNAWKSLVPELASTKRDAELNDEFQDLADRGALSEDFIIRSDGSEALKRKWLKSASATAEQSVPDSALQDFEGIASAMLMERSGETPGFTGKSNNAHTKRAVRRAITDYRKDFVTALRDGKSTGEAAQYAEQRFNDRFSNEQGLYKTTDFTEYENGQKITVGRYANFGPESTQEIKEPYVNLNQSIQQYGSAVVDQPGVVSLSSLQRTQQYLLQNKRIMIPPAIVTLADSTGGKLSVMDVLNRQLKANGLEQIPSDIFNVAKQTQDSIPPEWQPRLNYKPTYESTDAAMIGSGQDPIYNQRIPASVQNDTEFQSGVYAMADRLGVQASDLFAIMDFETGGTFNPGQRNTAGSGATGLIQFMPSTAAGLGTTTDQLAKMSRVQQLQYVEQYLRNTGIQPGASLSDLYMSVLFPAAIGKSDDFVLFGNGAMSGFGGRAYDQNRGLDKDGDGSITKGEAAVKVLGSANVWRQRRNLNPAVIPSPPQQQEDPQAPELSGYFTYNKDGKKIPAN